MANLNVEYTSSGAPTTERVEVWIRNAYDFVWQLLAEKAAVLHEFILVAGLKEGVAAEVAVRFKKGGLAAAPYSSGDASTWPAASRGAGTPVLPAVTALNVARSGNRLTLTFVGGKTGAWITAKFEKNINGAGWSTISDAVANTASIDYDLVGGEQSGVGDFRVTLRTNWVVGATFTNAGVDLGYPPPSQVFLFRFCDGGDAKFGINISLGSPGAYTEVEYKPEGGAYGTYEILVPGDFTPADFWPGELGYGEHSRFQFRARHDDHAGNISVWTESALSVETGVCP